MRVAFARFVQLVAVATFGFAVNLIVGQLQGAPPIDPNLRQWLFNGILWLFIVVSYVHRRSGRADRDLPKVLKVAGHVLGAVYVGFAAYWFSRSHVALRDTIRSGHLLLAAIPSFSFPIFALGQSLSYPRAASAEPIAVVPAVPLAIVAGQREKLWSSLRPWPPIAGSVTIARRADEDDAALLGRIAAAAQQSSYDVTAVGQVVAFKVNSRGGTVTKGLPRLRGVTQGEITVDGATLRYRTYNMVGVLLLYAIAIFPAYRVLGIVFLAQFALVFGLGHVRMRRFLEKFAS